MPKYSPTEDLKDNVGKRNIFSSLQCLQLIFRIINQLLKPMKLKLLGTKVSIKII